MTDIELHSPTGQEIQGTYEKVPGSASVGFAMGEGVLSFEHDGSGTKMFWDGSATQEIDDVALFIDIDGHDWLFHHLVPHDDGLSAETVKLIRDELEAGDALEAAKQLAKCMGVMPAGHFARVTINWPQIVRDLEGAYEIAKDLAVAAIQKELAAR